MFLGKEHLVENRLISTQDKAIYLLQRNNFYAVYTHMKKFAHFFQHAFSRSNIYMDFTCTYENLIVL
jgi:hypothetical protein